MEFNDSNIDICAITETWLKIDDDLTMKMVPPPNYNIHSTPRTTGKQGVDWPWSTKSIKCYT